PKTLTEVINWADKQALQYSEYRMEVDDKVEQYTIVGIDLMDFARDTIINPVIEVAEVENNYCSDDYIFIPVKQLKNNLIVIALEPKSELGLVTYKQFEHLIKKGEIFPILRVVN